MSRKTQTSLPFDVPVSKRRKWRVAGYCIWNAARSGALLGVRFDKVMQCICASDKPIKETAVAWNIQLGWGRIRAGAESKKKINEYRQLIAKTALIRDDIRNSLFREDPDFIQIVKLGVLGIARIEERVSTGELRLINYEDEHWKHWEYVAQRSLRERILFSELKEVTP